MISRVRRNFYRDRRLEKIGEKVAKGRIEYPMAFGGARTVRAFVGEIFVNGKSYGSGPVVIREGDRVSVKVRQVDSPVLDFDYSPEQDYEREERQWQRKVDELQPESHSRGPLPSTNRSES